MTRALTYLAESDVSVANLKAEVSRKEYLGKVARAKAYLGGEGSVESRKAQAELSPGVSQAEEELSQATAEYEKCRAKRATEELIVRIWQTVEASRRQGVLT